MEDLFQNIENIVDQTLELLPTALSGDLANRTFFVKENGKVDYHYYQGSINLDDSCFFTIKSYQTPDPEDYGYDSIGEMDFDACGYREQIEDAVQNHLIQIA